MLCQNTANYCFFEYRLRGLKKMNYILNYVWLFKSPRFFKWNLILLCCFFVQINVHASISEQKDTIKASFSITDIQNIDSVSYRVTINAGKIHGLIKKQGIVLTRYDANDLERNNQIIGSIEINKISDSSCTGVFTFYAGMQKFGLKPYDLSYVYLAVPKNMYRGILLEMAKINLFLKGSTTPFTYEDLKPLYSWQTIFSLRSQEDELAVISKLKEVAINTGEMFRGQEEDHDMFKIVYENGKFKGYNVLEILELTTEIDVLMYLEYVSEYPYKYMGVDFRFDETYATWAINETPLTSKAGKVLQAYISYLLKNNMLKGNSEVMKYYLDNIEETPEGWIENLNLSDSIPIYVSLLEYVHTQNVPLFADAINLKVGNLYQIKEKPIEAIPYFTEVIESNSDSLNIAYAYWYRANSNSTLLEYQKAIADYDTVIARLKYSGAYGSKGWILIKTGKWRDAKEPVAKAYSLDPTSFSWAINAGHAMLLSNQFDSANFYYNVAVNNVKSLDEYYLGIEDFDLFIANGWYEAECKAIKKNFEERIKIDSVFNKIKSKECFNNFLSSQETKWGLTNLDSAIYFASILPQPDYAQIRKYKRWKAYSLFSLKRYAESYQVYLEALQLNIANLNNEDLLLEDYTDLATTAEILNNEELTKLYKELQNNLERKIGMVGTSKNLFFFGAASQSTNQIALNAFRDSLISKNNVLYYDKFSESASKTNSLIKLRNFVQAGKENDVLMFYFTGNSYNKNGKKGFVFGQDSVSTQSLISELLFVPMQNLLIILDADDIGFIEEFIAYKNQLFSESKTANIEIITTNKKRHFLESKNSSTIGFSLLEKVKKDKTISTNNLKQELEQGLEKNALYFNLSSYSSGNSFVLYKAQEQNQVISKRGMRGIEVEPIRDEQLSAASKENSVAIVIGVGDYTHWDKLKNPKNDATALHKILSEKYGFNSKLLLDPSIAEIEAMLRSIKHVNAESIVVFFAGHGYFEEETQQGYIVGRDSKLPKDDPNMSTYYSHNRLVAMLENLYATSNVLLVIDACFSGTIESESNTMGEGVCNQADGKGLSKDMYSDISDSLFLLQNLGCPTFKYITSGGKEYVPDGNKEHSPFAAKLLESLEQNSGIGNDAILTYTEIRMHLQRVNPQPRYGRFGRDFSSSEFLLLRQK